MSRGNVSETSVIIWYNKNGNDILSSSPLATDSFEDEVDEASFDMMPEAVVVSYYLLLLFPQPLYPWLLVVEFRCSTI